LSDQLLIAARDGLRVAIRLSPRAKADRLVAIAEAAGGGRVLKASVTSPAEGGRANEALLRLLARAWDLPRRDLSIVAGSTSRNKAVQMAGDPERLITKITAAIAGLPGS
jgi:uncharacterized protein (TIGR00251 family)